MATPRLIGTSPPPPIAAFRRFACNNPPSSCLYLWCLLRPTLASNRGASSEGAMEVISTPLRFVPNPALCRCEPVALASSWSAPLLRSGMKPLSPGPHQFFCVNSAQNGSLFCNGMCCRWVDLQHRGGCKGSATPSSVASVAVCPLCHQI